MNFSAMMNLLAQTKLDDVFKSAQESMNQPPTSERVLALAFGAAALLVVLLVIQHRRSHQAAPKPVNHHGQLLKEMEKTLALKRAETRQLQTLAEEQECSSALVLLLCPSLLNKGLANKGEQDRQAVTQLIKRLRENAAE